MSKSRKVFERQSAADKLPLAGGNDELAAHHLEVDPAHVTSAASDDAAMRQPPHRCEATRLLSVLEDQQRSRDALRQSESRLRAILDSALDGIITIDHQGIVVEMNPAAEQMFGLAPNAAVGRELADVAIPPRLRSAQRQGLARYLETGESKLIGRRIEWIAWRADGSEFPVELTVTRIESNGPPMFTGHVRDISERKLAETRLRESEARYRAIVEDQTEFIVRWKPDGVRTFVNDAYCRCFGQTREQMLGTSFFPLISDEDLARVKSRLAKLTPQDPVSTDQHRVHLEDGTIGWQEWTDRALYDASGALIGYQSVGRDITESRRAERELRLRHEVIATSVTPTAFGDDQFRITYANQAFLDFFGFESEEQVLGMPNTRFESRPTSIAEINAALLEQGSWVGEVTTRKLDGTPVDALLRASMLRDEAGRPLYSLVTFWDITDRKQAERALQCSQAELRRLNTELEERVEQRTAELQDKNAELQAYAHTVSHDLRAPLRAMEGFAAALAEDYGTVLDNDGREFVHHILDSARRMDALVCDLLAYSRLGRTEMRRSVIELAVVIEESLAQLGLDGESAQAKVVVTEPMPAVLGHWSTLVRIFSNLIENATKFVQQGVQPEVRIWAEPKNERVTRVWVEDNGIGIDARYHKRVFRVFERLHGIETFPGTGLGLAIVARACERLGGRCGVESEMGRGSRFWIELPAGEESP